MRQLSARRLLSVMCLATAGCATPPPPAMSPDYAGSGGAAEVRGDWDAARRDFGQAVLVADQSGWPAQHRARMHYDYGRALGVTCFYGEAERELATAYDIDIITAQPRYPSLIEMARLALVQQKFVLATQYFRQALVSLDRSRVPRDTPLAYADVLDDYAQALTGAGQTELAGKMRRRALDVRAANGNVHEASMRTPYGTHCTTLNTQVDGG